MTSVIMKFNLVWVLVLFVCSPGWSQTHQVVKQDLNLAFSYMLELQAGNTMLGCMQSWRSNLRLNAC